MSSKVKIKIETEISGFKANKVILLDIEEELKHYGKELTSKNNQIMLQYLGNDFLDTIIADQIRKTLDENFLNGGYLSELSEGDF